MSLRATSRSQSAWWWIFGLLIAAPALLLAVLGLRTVRLERVEREQLAVEQQVQVARLADAALGSSLVDLEAELRRLDADGLTLAEPRGTLVRQPRMFVLDERGVLTFPRERVYFAAAGPNHIIDSRGVPWDVSLGRLIDRAQAAEAQGRRAEAQGLYRRIADTAPDLKDWARLASLRIEHQAGDRSVLPRLADPAWARSDALAPTGLPVALLASAYAGRVADAERARFLPLLQHTLEGVREGTWLLASDVRRFYDVELRRLMETSGADAARIADDPVLDELATIDRIVRSSPPSGRDAATTTIEREGARTLLFLWSPASDRGHGRTGLALSQSDLGALVDTAVRPLLATHSFDAVLRDEHGEVLWSSVAAPLSPARTEPIRAVRGWELAFTAPAGAGALDEKRLLWYGLILLLVSMLAAGLWMTARGRRQELALARMQADFVAAVSHEFKSPLTSICLYMERLSSGRASLAEGREYYAAVELETRRLERLVNRLLDSQQIQEGRKQYVFAPASLGEAAEEALSRLRPQADARGMQLVLQTVGDPVETTFDRAAMADAIENLVENAVKYSPEGSAVTVTVRADGDAVSVEVTDRGIGIDREDLPHIFDKFYRGRRGDRTDVRGTGLGLALVKAIVDAHGGVLSVSSVPEHGSRFTVLLPRTSHGRTGEQRPGERQVAAW